MSEHRNPDSCYPDTDTDTASFIEQHHQLLKQFRHREAKILLQQALVPRMEVAPFSMEVTRILDALALGCKEMDEFCEAAVYLAQSLAIKKLVLGPDHDETTTARARLDACPMKEGFLDDEAQRAIFSEWRSLSSLVSCMVTKKTSSGYEVRLIDDGRVGEIYTVASYSIGDKVEATIAGANFGKLRLKLARKHVIEELTQSSFGKPSAF